MLFIRGDIVLVDFLDKGLHPALVISNKAIPTNEGAYILAMITSKLQNDRFSYLIDERKLTQGRMPKESEIRCHLITLLDHSKISRRMNCLKARFVDEVVQKICKDVLR